MRMSLARSLISGDGPRSRVLAVVLVVIVVTLALVPFLFHGARPINVAAKICIFTVLVGSFDLLLGYTGIISFAQTMFFGIGAYGIAISLTHLGPNALAMFVGVAAALLASAVLSLVIGLFSLRVRAIFFAMITLAVAQAFQTLASQLSDFTGGEDGLSFSVPDVLTPAFSLGNFPLTNTNVDGKFLSYYLVFVVAASLFLMLLRIVNSPFGRVLQAIRENEFRAESLGYRTVTYRAVSSMLSAMFATLAGCLLAIWLRYNGPDTSLSFEIMVDLLLIVVIGGMGTMYGAVVGSTLFILAQSYLQDLMRVVSDGAAHIPLAGRFLSALLSADRWLLWLGVLFVLSVYYFPAGVVGKLRAARRA
jgi:branched-chain amino acid transport system permease protein